MFSTCERSECVRRRVDKGGERRRGQEITQEISRRD